MSIPAATLADGPDAARRSIDRSAAGAVEIARPAIDAHAKKFIRLSPFCVMATCGCTASSSADSIRIGN